MNLRPPEVKPPLEVSPALTPRLSRRSRLERPTIWFSPYAWAKLKWFCRRGRTEIGGFGIAAADDPLLIEDFVTVRQQVTSVSVAFDDLAVADFFEEQVDQGRQPLQFARVWCHTHPGFSKPVPSCIDEETFARVFGGCDWALMLILSQGEASFARLQFNVGPGGAMEIPVLVDYQSSFAGSDHACWEAEYALNIQEAIPIPRNEKQLGTHPVPQLSSTTNWFNWPGDLGGAMDLIDPFDPFDQPEMDPWLSVGPDEEEGFET